MVITLHLLSSIPSANFQLTYEVSYRVCSCSSPVVLDAVSLPVFWGLTSLPCHHLGDSNCHSVSVFYLA